MLSHFPRYKISPPLSISKRFHIAVRCFGRSFYYRRDRGGVLVVGLNNELCRFEDDSILDPYTRNRNICHVLMHHHLKGALRDFFTVVLYRDRVNAAFKGNKFAPERAVCFNLCFYWHGILPVRTSDMDTYPIKTDIFATVYKKLGGFPANSPLNSVAVRLEDVRMTLQFISCTKLQHIRHDAELVHIGTDKFLRG